MTVGAENHPPAGSQTFPGVLVNHRLIGRDIDAAVFFGGGKTKGMVVLIDGATHGTQ